MYNQYAYFQNTQQNAGQQNFGVPRYTTTTIMNVSHHNHQLNQTILIPQQQPSNHINQINQINHMNGMNQINQMNQMNQMNPMNPMNQMNSMNSMNHINNINQVNQILTQAPPPVQPQAEPQAQPSTQTQTQTQNTNQMKQSRGQYSNTTSYYLDTNPARAAAEMAELSSVPGYNKDLPVFLKKNEIINTVKNNKITLIVGHTGSGKTTQIPQYLIACSFANSKQIVCTQPRLVAAKSVAHRVAKEQSRNMGNYIHGHIGGTVGYQVRLDKKISDVTKLVFMTEGTLLRIAMGANKNSNESNLSKYSVIIIDEAHERTVEADLLMGYLKTVINERSCLKNNHENVNENESDSKHGGIVGIGNYNYNHNYNKRRQKTKTKTTANDVWTKQFGLANVNFRLVIMSATLDTERFLEYFDNPALVSIKGTLNPIDHYWLRKPTNDYIDASVSTVLSILEHTRDGDILVFMPGKNEIYQVIRRLRSEYNKLKATVIRSFHLPHLPQLEMHPLYGQLDHNLQNNALEPNLNPQEIRKCVVATNIAETSLTIDGIVYVVDCGLSKQTLYDSATGIEALSIQPISKASVKQRQGRSGRTGNKTGKVYHLYTQWGYVHSLPNVTPAEILRSSLVNETLMMLALGMNNPCEFDYIDAPNEMTLGRALNTLKLLHCIDNKGKITDIGKQVAMFPLSPEMSVSILTSMQEKYNCLNEMLTIASMLEVSERLWKLPVHSDFNSNGNENNLSNNNNNNNNNNGNNNNPNFRRRAGMSTSEALAKLKVTRAKWVHVNGDHLTLFNIYNAYQHIKHSKDDDDNKESVNNVYGVHRSYLKTSDFRRNQRGGDDNSDLIKRFCFENYLNFHRLQRAEEIRAQLERIVFRICMRFGKQSFHDKNQLTLQNAKVKVKFNIDKNKTADTNDSSLNSIFKKNGSNNSNNNSKNNSNKNSTSSNKNNNDKNDKKDNNQIIDESLHNSTTVIFKMNKHDSKNYYKNILKCLLSGHFLNVACLRDSGKYWMFRVCEMDENTNGIEFIEKTIAEAQSVFAKMRVRTKFKQNATEKEIEIMKRTLDPNWVLFDTVVRDGNCLKMRSISSFEPHWLIEMAPHCFGLNKLTKDESCVSRTLREVVDINTDLQETDQKFDHQCQHESKRNNDHPTGNSNSNRRGGRRRN